MSVDKNYYAIAGCDLTGYATDNYEDWQWTDEGEDYRYHQNKGRIQLFDDPMSGEHLYFGYILVTGDEYYFKTEKINISEVDRQRENVYQELVHLTDIGVINKKILDVDPPYQIIAFEECT